MRYVKPSQEYRPSLVVASIASVFHCSRDIGSFYFQIISSSKESLGARLPWRDCWSFWIICLLETVHLPLP